MLYLIHTRSLTQPLINGGWKGAILNFEEGIILGSLNRSIEHMYTGIFCYRTLSLSIYIYIQWGVPLPNISDYKHHHNRHTCFVSDTFYLQHLQLTNYCLLLQRGDNPRGIEIFVYIWLMILVVYSVHAPTEKISAFHSFQIVAKSSPPKTQQSPTKRGSWRSDCGESYCRRSPETPARCLLTGLEVAKGWPLKSQKTKITCLNTTINSHNNEEITMFCNKQYIFK